MIEMIIFKRFICLLYLKGSWDLYRPPMLKVNSCCAGSKKKFWTFNIFANKKSVQNGSYFEFLKLNF